MDGSMRDNEGMIDEIGDVSIVVWGIKGEEEKDSKEVNIQWLFDIHTAMGMMPACHHYIIGEPIESSSPRQLQYCTYFRSQF